MTALPPRTKPTDSHQQIPDGFPGPTTVLLITARSDNGNVAKHIIDLIRTLKSLGIRVFIASPVTPPYGIEFKKLADKFIPIPHRDFSFGAMWKIRQSVRKHHVSVIHSHGRTAGVYSRLLGLLTHASIAHSYHGIQNEPGFAGVMKLLLDRALSGFKFDPVFSSEIEHQKAISKGVVQKKREAYLIENAVDLDRYPKRKAAEIALGRIDKSVPESVSGIRVGAYLRPESPKGHEHFLRIAQEAGSQAKFTCAGISRERLAKIGRIPDNLEVMGPLGDPMKWLYSLDVFVSTSTSDGQLVGALEAMAAGAVCLLSNIPAHEPLYKQNAVVLFDPKSVQGFLTALDSVRRDPALRDMLTGNSRYMIERFYDAGTFKTKIMNLYRTGAKRAMGLVL